ncbi:MAG: ABC transporter ATP-binding protein [Nitrospirales bacterium]
MTAPLFKRLTTNDDKNQPRNSFGTWKLSVWFLRLCGSGEGTKIVIGLLVLLLGSGIALLQPWPLKLVVDSVLGTHPPPEFLEYLTTFFTSHTTIFTDQKFALLFLLSAGVLLIQVLMGSFTVLSTYILVAIGLRMVFRLRCRLFDHLQRLSLAFHDTTTVGDSLYRVTWDTYCVQSWFNSGIIPALTASFTLAGIGIIMLSLDWLLTLVALAIAIPLIVLIKKLDQPMTERSMRFHERESDISSRVQETLTGIRAVQAFGREHFESQRFQSHAQDSLLANLRLTILQSGSQAIVGLLLALGTTLVVWIGASRVLSGHLTVGDVVLLVSYVAMLYKPLETLAYTATTIQSAAASGRRVLALLEATPDVSDLPQAVPLPASQACAISFENVSFQYHNGLPVLRNLSLDMQKDQCIAVVGSSGAGKTTLVNLLLRFYDPTEGRVMLNGYDIRHVTVQSLRDQIAIVLQEPVLFCSTIRENIAYGLPSASFENIQSAAQSAGAHYFITALPQGYDTEIGERGVMLSGGQRQRIAMARAFLKNAPILIMDEPTSALDTETEQQLLKALECLMKGRTTIIIAHRLSTIRKADRIILLQDGQVVEHGTHTELLQLGQGYARLYHTQFDLHPLPMG